MLHGRAVAVVVSSLSKCALTIHSSRTRPCLGSNVSLGVVALPPDLQVAGRLNSGVRPLSAVQRFGSFCVVVARSLRLVLVRCAGWLVVLRGVPVQLRSACASCSTVPTLQHRGRLGVESSSERRSGYRGAAGASRRARRVVVCCGGLTIHSSRNPIAARSVSA